MDNEAVPKALFKPSDDKLTFTEALQVLQEIEEAVRVANDTVYGQASNPVYKVEQPKGKANPPRASTHKAKDTSGEAGPTVFQGIRWQVLEE